MAYLFKSRAAGDLLMLDKTAKQILTLIGKDPAAATGIITVGQIQPSIEKLNEAIEKERLDLERKAAQQSNNKQADKNDLEEEENDKEDDKDKDPISLKQRAWPFIQMLQLCLKAEADIVWGV